MTPDEGGRTPGAGHRRRLDDRGSRIEASTSLPRAGVPASRGGSRSPSTGDDIYLSGIPGPKTPNWLANLAARPQFTFHLKHGVVADLPVTVTVTVDPADRRRVLAVFVEELNHCHGPDSPYPEAVPDEWVARSPLAKVTSADTD